MASKMRLLSGQLPRVAVCYNGGLKALGAAVQQRSYSIGRTTDTNTTIVFEARREQSEHPESELFTKSIDDKFGEQFRHFPMPGNMTTTQQYLKLKEKTAIMYPKTASGLDQSDVLTTPTAHDRQFGTAHTFSEASRKLPPTNMMEPGASVVPTTLECAAQQCPELARKHFSDLFPNRDIQKGTLTVMTLAQKTENDMSEWSDRVDRERDDVMSQFVSTASAVCEALQREGYWADFIDPTSGRPYLGPFTNATLFETDERYRNFGFSIEDLGCCKVILHPKWGTHAFVGSIFSDAPLDAPILQKLLPRQQRAALEPAAVIAVATEGICPPDMAVCESSKEQVEQQKQPTHAVAPKVENNAEIRILKHEDKC